MTGIFDFYTFIGILSSGYAFLLGSTLLWNKKADKGRIWITGLLLILCFNVAHDTLIQSQLLRHFPHFLYTGEFFNYLIWPFLFFYFKKKRPGSLKAPDYLHFLPFLVFNLNRLDLYLSNALEKKSIISSFYEYYLTRNTTEPEMPALEQILEDLVLFRLQGLIYIGFITFLFVRKRKVEPLSGLVFAACCLLWTIQYIFHLLPYLQPLAIDSNNKAEIVARGFFILAFAHLRFQQPSQAPKTYAGSGLGMNEETRIYQQLTELFEKDRPHLKNDLTLSTLATMLDTNTRYLSQVIHTRYGKNYTDFVNTYRIAEVKMRLQDQQYAHLTLDAIAQDSGFNSIATCQRSFKKLEGIPPSRFRL